MASTLPDNSGRQQNDAFTQDISIILFLQAVHARVMSYAGRFLADYYQVPQRVIFVSRSNSSEYEELQ